MWTGCLHPYLVVCQRNTHSEAKFSSQSYSESSECKTDHVIKVHISVHTWAKCWHEERDIGAYMFQPKQSPSEKWTWTGLEWHSFLRSKVNWGMREMRTKARPFLTGKDYRGLWVWGYNAPQTASVLLPWLPLSSMVSEPGTLHLATFTKRFHWGRTILVCFWTAYSASTLQGQIWVLWKTPYSLQSLTYLLSSPSQKSLLNSTKRVKYPCYDNAI